MNVNEEELNKLIKRYKKIQKYRKSSLFAVQSMDETENMIKKMVEEITKDKNE